jgi:hypothetical protein
VNSPVAPEEPMDRFNTLAESEFHRYQSIFNC